MQSNLISSLYVALRIESRALCVLGKGFASELPLTVRLSSETASHYVAQIGA